MIRGADSRTVRRAVVDGDPLPGTRGFAGRLADPPDREELAPVRDELALDHDEPVLVRDVLGRVSLFSERGEPSTWSHDPRELADPAPVPAGSIRTSAGDEQVWSLPERSATADDTEAVRAVGTAVDDAIEDVPDAAVAFSGGVDSALVADGVDGPLYVAGFSESHDVDAARDAARGLGGELHVVEIVPADLEAAVPTVARAIARTNAMDVSIALPLFLVAERAAADGQCRLAVGQGADELFGGYAKVANAPDDPRVEAATVRGARREMVHTLPGQIERDVLAIRAAGVDPVAPLLDDRVVDAALGLPGHLLVDDRGERKVALRRAARKRLPARVAFREKKAVQYGSLVSRELDRLARQAGFKQRMDDHVSRYVESRLESG